MENKKTIVAVGLLFLFGLFLGYIFPTGEEYVKETKKADTIIDTQFVDRPVHDTIYKAKRVVRIPAEDIDSTEGDSIYLATAVTRHYCDSNYEAWVSGIDAFLDSIKVFNRIVIREVTREKLVYRPTIQTEKTLNLGGFVSSSMGFDAKHLNLSGGIELAIHNRLDFRVGYNLGDASYPFVGIKYKFKFTR